MPSKHLRHLLSSPQIPSLLGWEHVQLESSDTSIVYHVLWLKPWDHVLSDGRYGECAGWGFQETFLRADRLSEESRAFTLCFPLLPTPEADAMQEEERHLVTRGQAPAGCWNSVGCPPRVAQTEQSRRAHAGSAVLRLTSDVKVLAGPCSLPVARPPSGPGRLQSWCQRVAAGFHGSPSKGGNLAGHPCPLLSSRLAGLCHPTMSSPR